MQLEMLFASLLGVAQLCETSARVVEQQIDFLFLSFNLMNSVPQALENDQIRFVYAKLAIVQALLNGWRSLSQTMRIEVQI